MAAIRDNEGPSEPAGWRATFRRADSLPEGASAARKQARGRNLEKILWAMFDEAGLRPRLSYRPRGEEIDGSIWLDGRTLLVEAKWTKEPHPASSLYQFRGKVDGKLVGTQGLFISMAGFSRDSVDALVAGKELNLILADGDDIRQIVDERISVRDALELKLRAAGESGTPFLPLSHVTTDRRAQDLGYGVVFVEGKFDARVLQIVRKIFDAPDPVTIIPTAGPANMAPLIDAIFGVARGQKRVTAVVDGDDAPQRLLDDLGEVLGDLDRRHDQLQAAVVPLDPNLESVFGLVAPGGDRDERRALRRMSDKQIEGLLRAADLPARCKASAALATVLQGLGVDIPEVIEGESAYLAY